MKRVFDIFVSVVSIFILSPLLLFTCFLIKVDSKGGIIFRQERVGLFSRPFMIYKFRSMVENAQQDGPYFTSADDKRITRLGKLIRKLSIDELPQLFNVLKGDMSIVGPRPNVFAQREYYTDSEWDLRHSVKPGITGLAQATLRSDATHETRTKLDLEYVQKSSFFFDVYIIILTVKQLMFKGGN